MAPRHALLIVFLAAIWGGAFTLIRNAVPALGPLGLSATQWSAGVLAVIKATVPLWGPLIARVWLGDRITPSAGVGLAFGNGGVALLTSAGPAPIPAAGAAGWC